jgi:hypothetical protein
MSQLGKQIPEGNIRVVCSNYGIPLKTGVPSPIWLGSTSLDKDFGSSP